MPRGQRRIREERFRRVTREFAAPSPSQLQGSFLPRRRRWANTDAHPASAAFRVLTTTPLQLLVTVLATDPPSGERAPVSRGRPEQHRTISEKDRSVSVPPPHRTTAPASIEPFLDGNTAAQTQTLPQRRGPSARVLLRPLKRPSAARLYR